MGYEWCGPGAMKYWNPPQPVAMIAMPSCMQPCIDGQSDATFVHHNSPIVVAATNPVQCSHMDSVPSTREPSPDSVRDRSSQIQLEANPVLIQMEKDLRKMRKKL